MSPVARTIVQSEKRSENGLKYNDHFGGVLHFDSLILYLDKIPEGNLATFVLCNDHAPVVQHRMLDQSMFSLNHILRILKDGRN